MIALGGAGSGHYRQTIELLTTGQYDDHFVLSVSAYKHLCNYFIIFDIKWENQSI